MTQKERRIFLMEYLLQENLAYRSAKIPQKETEQQNLLRSLMNIRPPDPIDTEFLTVQDEYLQTERTHCEVTDYADGHPIANGIYLWKGDITQLKCDAIVNAANSTLLGCFYPCHTCIDNAIHSAAGIQLRLACHELMQKQGREEPAGQAKITAAFNLPCKYVLHTVGPIVSGNVTEKDCTELAWCYRSCLKLAEKYSVKSLAFCCISTGEFHFPNKKAAEIAVRNVQEYKEQTHSNMEIIFNVFTEKDYAIYKNIFAAH